MKREKTTAAILFLATIATTIMAGYYFSLPIVEAGSMKNIWWGCISFSAALMLILGCHEMGHKLTSMRYGIHATPPYFIPLPSLAMFGIDFVTLGTLGAIIKIKSPLPDDDAAIDMGLNGPIAGFLVALPVTVVGLILSVRSPTPPAIDFTFGKSLILYILSLLLAPGGEGYIVWHPIVYAGWVGFFITALNLIPVGQLDGGHVARAIIGRRRFRTFSWVVIIMLAFLGYFHYVWWVWTVLAILLTFRGYPRVMNEFEPLSAEKKRKALIGLILFILCFIPVPIRV
ncbi:MAG: site-2 protease family protein [bacterium]